MPSLMISFVPLSGKFPTTKSACIGFFSRVNSFMMSETRPLRKDFATALQCAFVLFFLGHFRFFLMCSKSLCYIKEIYTGSK